MPGALPGGDFIFADSLALLLLLRMTTVVAANANAKQELSAEFKGRGGEEWGAKSAFSASPFYGGKHYEPPLAHGSGGRSVLSVYSQLC